MTLDYDSLLTHFPPSPLQQTDEYLQGRQLPDADVAGLLRVSTASTEQWVVFGVIALLVVMLLIICSHLDYLAFRIKDFFSSERRFSVVPQQTTASEVPTLVIPMLIGSLSLSLIAADTLAPEARLLRYAPDPWLLCALLSGATLVWLAAKTLLYSMVNWVFFDPTRSRKWLGSYFFLTAVFLALMLPLAILYLYADLSLANVSNCLLGMLILYEILLFFKMIAHFQTKRYGILLIFLYFCTAELLPLFAVSHFVQTSSLLH